MKPLKLYTMLSGTMASYRAREFAQGKIKLILAFSGVTIIISLGYWLIHPFVPFNVPRLLFLILPASLSFCCFLLWHPIPYRWIAQGFLFCFWFSFTCGAYYSGGISSLTIPWLALVPLLANFIDRRESAVVWVAVCVTTILGYSLFSSLVPPLQYAEGPWRHTASTIGLCFVLFLLSALFVKSRNFILDSLQTKNDELLNHQRTIVDQNQKISTQNVEILSQLEFIETQHHELMEQKIEIEFINKKLEEKVREIIERNATLERHWTTLIQISKDKIVNFGTRDEGMNRIAAVIAECLSVNRVSIWHFLKGPERIECITMVASNSKICESGFSLPAESNRDYFEALKREWIIAAPDAYTNKDTCGFTETYLRPYNVASLLDAPFFLDSELKGVLCCEHSSPRHWTSEDIILVASMAEIVSLVFRLDIRRKNELKIATLADEVERLKQNR